MAMVRAVSGGRDWMGRVRGRGVLPTRRQCCPYYPRIDGVLARPLGHVGEGVSWLLRGKMWRRRSG
jgi:hypothetical protein